MNESQLNVIITGSTGMVGEGVLFECLNSDLVNSILVINRKTCGYQHPKLKEILHPDFFDINPIKDQLKDYDTCFFCLGVSSVGMKEDEYRRLTYDLTMNFARTLSEVNPNLTFCYISGASTDSTEKGRMMWARVKGKTENDLMKLPFGKVYNFRPGMLKPTKGLKNTLPYYKYVTWMFPLIKILIPNSASTLSELGQAMIRCAYYKPDLSIVEVSDIIKTSKLNSR